MSETETELPLSENVGYLLNRSAQILRERLADALTPLSLSFQEYVVLRMVEMEVSETQQGVGRRTGIDRTSMVDIVDRLEERELVDRVKDEKDRRRLKLLLTPRGRKTLAHAKRIAEKEHKAFLEPLSQEEWAMVRGCLVKLIGENSPE